MRFLPVFVFAAAALLQTYAVAAGPLDRFAGRWAGWGQLSTASGQREKLKCVATYFVKDGGAAAHQNFRCNSDSYRLDATVDYTAAGASLSGTWREQIYSVGGSLRGKVNGGRISMRARADNFVAAVVISSSRCTQTIRIEPSGGVEISLISVELKRC